MRQSLARLVEKHPIVIYTLARAAIFLAVALPMYAFGFRGLLLLCLALLTSGALSLWLLNGLRARFSGSVSGFFQTMNRRIDEASRAEDDDEPAPAEPARDGPAPDRLAPAGPASDGPAPDRPEPDRSASAGPAPDRLTAGYSPDEAKAQP